MITILICIALFIILFIVHDIKQNKTLPTFLKQGFLCYLVSSMVGFLLGMIFGIIVAFALPMDLKDEYSTKQLVSLQDNSSVYGDFFLGCGTIDGSMKYVLYVENDGFFEMKQLEYDKVKIKIVETSPKLITIKERVTYNWINYFALDETDVRYIVEVPEGTILNNYKLDAQ